MYSMRVGLGTAISFLVLLASTLPATSEDPAPSPSRGEAVAVNVNKGPALDGTLKDPLWEKCPPWPMGECTSDIPLRFKTWAKVLCDGSHLFVGVHCDEPDTDSMPMQAVKHDDPVWNDDSVEVFVRADPQQPYCQFVVNPRGVYYDARNKDPKWESSAEVRATIDRGKSWTVTLRIPLQQLGAYVGDGQIWTMNVNRTRHARRGVPTLQYSWAVMTEADYHASQEFGILSEINVPRRADGVTRVRSGPAPRPLVLNRGKQIGGVTVYHKMKFDENQEDWEPVNGGRLARAAQAVSGRALHVECTNSFSGARVPISIRGSRGLKMALHMQGRNLRSAGVNIYDTIAGDNTTPYGHRYINDTDFTPVLYFLDRWRYNSRTTGYVGPSTLYRHVQFHGPQTIVPNTSFNLDNVVIYRGDDRQPPEKVTGLKAEKHPHGLRLSWNPAEDNVATQLYVVAHTNGHMPFRKMAETVAPEMVVDSFLKDDTHFRVCAVDFEENLGPWSDVLQVPEVGIVHYGLGTREETDRLGYADHVRRIHARGAGKVRRGHATLFGDSLTAATTYPQCAQAAFGTLTVNAFGYPRMRTGFGRDKVQEILERDNPEFMFILYGTNNNKREDQLPAAMDDLAAIAKSCEQHGTVPVLGTIPPRGWTPESAPEASFNRQVVQLCHKIHVPIGYIFEDFQAAGERKKYMGKDGVHWQGAGMEIAARAWGNTLRQIRFVLRDQK